MGKFESWHNSTEQETILDNFERKFWEVVDFVWQKIEDILNIKENKEVLKLYDAELFRIVDWDTIEVKYKWRKEKIRMIWINTPEKRRSKKRDNRKECFWEEASDYITKLISWKDIQLEFDETQDTRWKYKRLLAYVRCEWENINLKMIEDWYAYAYIYDYSNPCKYQNEFARAQIKAEVDNKWLWAPNTCNWERTPWMKEE